jgi:septum formation protein
LVIAADTMVTLGERIFGKPSTMDEAQSMLFALAGNTHEVHTGVCLRQTEPDWPEGLLEEFLSIAQVTFRPLHPHAITRYLERVNPLDKAGAYALQEDEGELITQVEGDPDAVIGLPVKALQETIARLFPKLWPTTTQPSA